MTPERVYERFLKEFPQMESQVDKFYKRTPRHRSPDAADSIRIVLRNHRVLIFKVYKNGTWRLEHV